MNRKRGDNHARQLNAKRIFHQSQKHPLEHDWQEDYLPSQCALKITLFIFLYLKSNNPSF